MTTRRPRSGFSLLEVLLVMVLLGLVAALAAGSMVSPRRSLSLQDALQQVAACDRWVRRDATRSDSRRELLLDLDLGRVVCLVDGGRSPGPQAARMAQGVGIAEVRTVGGRITAGKLVLSCSSVGVMPSYALLLKGPGGQQRWVVFAGLTGQHDEVPDEQTAQDILQSTRNDPH